MDELDFKSDSYDDIVAKDPRYNARAYSLLMDVIHYLSGSRHDRHMGAEDIMDEFKERTLELFGPLSYTVLTEWGLKGCEDLGEMMFNLVDSGRIQRDENDSKESFLAGYDFREIFLGPYAV